MYENSSDHKIIHRERDPSRINEPARLEQSATCRNADRGSFTKQQQQRRRGSDESARESDEESRNSAHNSASDVRRNNTIAGSAATAAAAAVLFSASASLAPVKLSKYQANTNGHKKEANCNDVLTNGREMAPTMGVPPPPPAPHMGPDGLILPRKPYNPCLISNTHKDLRRELLFNQKAGRNVLNQKSELQIAMEKQRETARLKEAEKNREETYKDDPRTVLQRALEQRAKQINNMEQHDVEPTNPLVTARARLRPCTDLQ